MSILHSQLALFGAIDDMVVQARQRDSVTDREVVAMVETLLPNSTGFGQAGWFRELERFLNKNALSDGATPLEFPTVSEAVAELRDLPFTLTSRTRERAVRGFEHEKPYNPALDPVLARSGFAAVVIDKIFRMTRELNLTDNLEVLPVAAGAFTAGGQADAVRAEDLSTRIDEIHTREDWTAIATDAVNPEFATNALPCFGSLQQVDGQYCSTVTTDTTAGDLKVTDIEKIVDPMNWSYCSKFFCVMKQNSPNRNGAGWSRVREQVSAECGEYQLITDLVFYKSRYNGGIFINYDIDPQRTDPGFVEIDSGYIWISPLHGDDPTVNGVRIRTSKQERINGLSPCATAALACLMGWADAGREMLAGTARDVMNGTIPAVLKPFYPSSQDDPNEKG